MNAPIVRLFAVFMVLFAGLVGATSWWTVLAAESVRDNPKNQRALLKSLEVRRGAITSAGGTELARSVQGPGDTYEREYSPQAETVSHVLGYYYPLGIGDAGTERFRADALSGVTGELDTLFEEIAGGRPDVGDDVRTNLDLDAQRVAIQQLGDRKGAVVVMEPDTGRVRVMASVPGYDPAALEDDDVFTDLTTDNENSPLLNRATQSLYPPGSTFKVLTAVAAIDSGKFTPDSVLDGSSPQTFSATPLSNFAGQSFGSVTLTQALTQSINTVWAEVGVQIGDETMTKYMERFGLYEEPPIDYPAGQVETSGVYDDEGLVKPTDAGLDLARIAIGQAGLLTTPLQMAMIAAAVGNDGVLMEPRIAREITDRDGRTVEEIEPERVRRVMSKETAQQVTAMMRNVVDSGSGVAAALEGTGVAGKTGTAEIDIQNNINQLWFIAFAPSDDPEVAIAVTVERAVGGQGGQVAAPIARAVLESLLD
jgi:peptidoglycan glycosyltransferase